MFARRTTKGTGGMCSASAFEEKLRLVSWMALLLNLVVDKKNLLHLIDDINRCFFDCNNFLEWVHAAVWKTLSITWFITCRCFEDCRYPAPFLQSTYNV